MNKKEFILTKFMVAYIDFVKRVGQKIVIRYINFRVFNLKF